MSTILSDLKAEVMKRDAGLENVLSGDHDLDCKVVINELIYFREKLLDFLISQLDLEKVKTMEFEKVVHILQEKYMRIMHMALN